MADESYPAELRYHSEHDWARVESQTATFGITGPVTQPVLAGVPAAVSGRAARSPARYPGAPEYGDPEVRNPGPSCRRQSPGRSP
jgi:hypothetical protein